MMILTGLLYQIVNNFHSPNCPFNENFNKNEIRTSNRYSVDWELAKELILKFLKDKSTLTMGEITKLIISNQEYSRKIVPSDNIIDSIVKSFRKTNNINKMTFIYDNKLTKNGVLFMRSELRFSTMIDNKPSEIRILIWSSPFFYNKIKESKHL